MRWLESVISQFSTLRMVLVCLTGGLALMFLSSLPLSAAEEPDWLDEFEDICSQTQGSDSLSLEELTALLARIDAVLPVIEASENPKKKVYVFRLKKCRSLFEYIIQLREEGRLEGKLVP